MAYTETSAVSKDSYDINRKVAKLEQLVDEISIQDNYWIKPFTDFDGPVRTRSQGGDEYQPGVDEAFNMLIDDEYILNPGIISGRGLGYLLSQVDELGISEIDVAGEMGATYFTQEDLEREMPDSSDPRYLIPEEEESKDDIYAFNLRMMERMADDGLQFMYGDNLSNVVGSACIEAFGADLEEDRFSIEDTVYAEIYDHANSQKVQEQILNYASGGFADQFEFHNDMIRFEKSIEAAEAITEVFTANPFIPWGFHDEGAQIAMFPEYRARDNFEHDQVDEFVSSVISDHNAVSEGTFWHNTYHDNSFDFGKQGYQNLKTKAAERMVETPETSRKVIPSNVGDKPTDVLQIEDSIFFAQEGTQAHEYCQREGIDHVVVENATEAFIIQHEFV